jgi:hypothetical protein
MHWPRLPVGTPLAPAPLSALLAADDPSPTEELPK